ncbi:metal-dependent hydrolase [Sphingomicrobium astaxanthinifaciens]|uniref:metal-dependent hydrolase n=1 Tax=Sphingomicrobium astaxanthinifaciens TaxID=1227949 RepID=UPI001FCB3CE0|nr:metal-dependent hydrolase [Sphingomicrobium astaxanthinifaciens]MCJ7420647.1 metal-dependent hydrolase [Sphingomicrobium astaxanthinifaciens]
MDNITHSLAGALLGQMGLKRLTPRAMPTLIIAANLPDIDALALLLGTEHLAIRRGLTHAPLAMLVLPILLTLAVWGWDRWRPGRERVRPGWLYLCALLGTLSHPLLDWLNVYGIRWLEPFSHRWFYGDTLFIIDIWVWAILVLGVWTSRSIEQRGGRHFPRPAWLMFVLLCAYIAGNGWITGLAERQGQELVGKQWRIEPGRTVAAPVPIKFWQREILWRGGGLYGFGDYHWPEGVLLSGQPQFVGLNHPLLQAARGRDDVEAYLFWSRLPVIIERDGRVLLADQRFLDERVSSSFTIDLGAAQ